MLNWALFITLTKTKGNCSDNSKSDHSAKSHRDHSDRSTSDHTHRRTSDHTHRRTSDHSDHSDRRTSDHSKATRVKMIIFLMMIGIIWTFNVYFLLYFPKKYSLNIGVKK